MGAEECHGAARSKAASGNLVGRDTGLVKEGNGGKAEGICDVRQVDVSPRTIDKNGMKRSVGGCIVQHAKVLHMTGKGLDGANIGMAGRGAMANRFPPNGIFLVRESRQAEKDPDMKPFRIANLPSFDSANREKRKK